MKKLSKESIDKEAWKWVNHAPAGASPRSAISFYAGAAWAARELEAEAQAQEAHLLRFAGVVSGVPMEELKNIWRNYRERHGI